jgi:uncharacterized SAM-binding protein YcdF (DUF218 family)
MAKKKESSTARGSFTHEQFARLLGFVANDELEKADAILFIQGDGLSRPEVAAELYYRGVAPKIIVTGEIRRNPKKSESRIESVLSVFRKKGIPDQDIIIEPNSINTREQALEMMKLIQSYGWKKIILAVALYHKPRVYATFIRAMNEVGLRVVFIACPVRGLSWFAKTGEGTRYHLLGKELKKINAYAAKGHVASFREVIAYERWKEGMRNSLSEA